jgi:hypothetical protein
LRRGGGGWRSGRGVWGRLSCEDLNDKMIMFKVDVRNGFYWLSWHVYFCINDLLDDDPFQQSLL